MKVLRKITAGVLIASTTITAAATLIHGAVIGYDIRQGCPWYKMMVSAFRHPIDFYHASWADDEPVNDVELAGQFA